MCSAPVATIPPALEPCRPLEYQSGFGNQFSTEALRNALPQGRNSPQHCPYGLYA
ncbi:Homogentisate 1,2-dioxygenase, partial [mine drainage metagenome]